MNRLIILFITTALLLPDQSKAQVEQYPMSFQEAVDYALDHNQNILNAQLDVVSAEAFVKENISVIGADLIGHGNSTGKKGHINSIEDYFGNF